MTRIIFLLLAVSYTVFANAQFQGDVFRPKTNAKVIGYNNHVKVMPWAGGVNAPHIAMADLNMDKLPDLVIFERHYGVRTFINTGVPGNFVRNIVYEDAFNKHLDDPHTRIGGYLKLLDYNRDTIPDLILRGYNGITVYRGYYQGSMLQFTLYKPLRYADSDTTSIAAYVEPDDIPGAADIDNDGDIDFISYHLSGTQIAYYKNCQIEHNLPKDSIDICLEDLCWAKTFQSYERNQQLGVSCDQSWRTCSKPGRGAQKTTHSGNTLCLIDMDGDNDLDYFNGNVSFPEIQFFTNGIVEYGSKIDTAIAQDSIWKDMNGRGVHVPLFPAAYAVDYDMDDDLDLFFCPSDASTEDYKSISYYENIGNSANPKYVFRSDTFLVDEMIDVGTASYPVFYDYDRDGLKDLFIGNSGRFDTVIGGVLYIRYSSIAYYKNTSDQNGVSFKLIDDNFLNIRSMNMEGAAPAFGDLDNDSIDDLIIGKTDGTFAYFRNTADSTHHQPKFVLSTNELKDASSGQVLDVGDFATPFIYDMDKDGKNDLVSGNQLGDLYYFNNYSTQVGLVGIKEVTKNLGGVKMYDSILSYGYSAPYIGPMDDTEIDYLVVGNFWGELYRYDGFQNGSMPATFALIDSNYSWINVRNRATPAFANLDNDADKMYEMVIGNILGGLNYYQQDFPVSIKQLAGDTGMEVMIAPNPANDQLSISWDNTQDNVLVQIISVTGQIMYSKTNAFKVSSINIDVSGYASGMYYCVIQTSENKIVKPVSVLH